MSRPYEDPRKSDLTGKLRIALDAAGYEVRDPEPISLPSGTDLGGDIRGDVQAVDSEGRRFAYYVRTDGRLPVPQWIARLATLAHDLDDARIYIVVEETTTLLEQSCRGCGAGLLRLVEEVDYELRESVSPDDYTPVAIQAANEARLRQLRARLINKQQLNIDAATRDFVGIRSATYGMPEDVRDDYLEGAETTVERWREWGQRLGAKLDELAIGGSTAAIDALEAEIEAGIEVLADE